ncbi:MAG: hypothetical protein KY468_20690 [Armatimonadetes bacterium]|nr:hypothetical protein [Armatimonadota bacterium]
MRGWGAGIVLGTLVVLPLAALRSMGAPWSAFGWGILSWMIGVFVKFLLMIPLDTVGTRLLSPGANAALSGILSAVTELGAAAWLLRRIPLTLPNVLAFGVGIGAFEVFFTLLMGWVEGLENPALPRPGLSFVDGFFLAERTLALIGHTASRVLIAVALAHSSLPAAFLAILLFSLIDGTAGYGILRQWDWEDPGLMTRFLLFVAAVVLVEAAAAWGYGRTLPGR